MSIAPKRPVATQVATIMSQKRTVRAASPSPVTLGCSVAPRPDGRRCLMRGAGTRARGLGPDVAEKLGHMRPSQVGPSRFGAGVGGRERREVRRRPWLDRAALDPGEPQHQPADEVVPVGPGELAHGRPRLTIPCRPTQTAVASPKGSVDAERPAATQRSMASTRRANASPPTLGNRSSKSMVGAPSVVVSSSGN